MSDTQAPEAPSLNLAPASDSGLAEDGLTNDATPTLNGVAEAGATVKVYDGATLLGSVVAGSDETWTFTAATLGDGVHSLAATATDAAGNVSGASEPLALSVDTAAPQVSSIVRASASPTAASHVDYTVTFSEGVSGVDAGDFQLTATGTAAGAVGLVTAVNASTYTVSVTGLSGAGDLRLDLKTSGTGIADAAANTIAGGFSGGQSYTVRPPLAAPTISLSAASDSGAVGDRLTNDATPTLTGTAPEGAAVQVYDGATLLGSAQVANGGWSYTPTAPLSDGSHNLTAVASAGGETAVSSVLPVAVDTVGPGFTVSYSAEAFQMPLATFTFNEAPVDFGTDDLSLTGGMVLGMNARSATVFAVELAATMSNLVWLSVRGEDIHDAAGNAGVHTQLALDLTPTAPPPPVQVDHKVLPDGKVGATYNVTDDYAGRLSLGSDTGHHLDVSLPGGVGLTGGGPTEPTGQIQDILDVIGQMMGTLDELQLSSSLSAGLGAQPFLLQSIQLSSTILPSAPVALSGSLSGALDAVLLDGSRLPSGAQIVVNNVAFLGVSGALNISGGAGRQVVFADAAGQQIVLGADDDELHGGGGEDTVGSAAGDDRLFGDDGDDVVFGGEGDDLVQGNAGNDTVSGDAGDDLVYGGKGGDQLSGGAGADRMFGDLGGDLLHGDEGDDQLQGGEGDDRLFGDAGRDVLRGGQGADQLFGGDGDDWLSGDRGDDTLTGGAGADVFHSFAGAGVDRVTDFHAAEGDRLLLERGASYTVAQVGFDTVISLGGGGEVVLVGVSRAALSGDWLVFA